MICKEVHCNPIVVFKKCSNREGVFAINLIPGNIEERSIGEFEEGRGRTWGFKSQQP